MGETTNATYCLADLDGVCKFVVLITTFILLAFLREKTCAVVDYSYVRTRMLSWGQSHQTHWGHGWHVIDLRLPIYPTNNPRLNAGCPLQEAVLNCRAGNNPMYKLTGENSALSSELFSVRTVVPW